MSEPSPEEQVAGRSLVTRHAIRDLVRAAVISSYGVTGLGGSGLAARLAATFGLGQPAIEVVTTPSLVITLHVQVAYGVPVAEVARQVESAVRYGLRRAIGREPDSVAIHVDGFRVVPSVGARPDRIGDAPAVGGVHPAVDEPAVDERAGTEPGATGGRA